MNAWDTVLGQRTMEGINRTSQDIYKVIRNYPTLRDQFAISAMNIIVHDIGTNSNLDSILGEYGDKKTEKIAEAAYKLADAMLAEKSKE